MDYFGGWCFFFCILYFFFQFVNFLKIILNRANHSWDVRDGKLYLFFSPTAKLLFNAMQEVTSKQNLKKIEKNNAIKTIGKLEKSS